jgi:hypothetical protein
MRAETETDARNYEIAIYSLAEKKTAAAESES